MLTKCLAPGSETTELLERKLSGEDYAGEKGTLGLQQPLTPFHATEQADSCVWTA